MQIQVTLPNDEQYGELAGKAVTVPAESLALNGKFLPMEEVNEKYVPKGNVQESVQERLKEQAENLKKNPEHIREILTMKGLEVDEDGEVVKGEGLTEEDLQKKIEQQADLKLKDSMKEIQPKLQKLETVTSENDQLRRQVLHLEIKDAARDAGVLPQHFETLPGAPDHSATVISQTESFFDVDDNGNWALVDSESDSGDFVVAETRRKGRPHAGPREYFERLKRNESVAPKWFGSGGPGKKTLGDTTGADSAEEGGGDAGGGDNETTLKDRQANLRKRQTSRF